MLVNVDACNERRLVNEFSKDSMKLFFVDDALKGKAIIRYLKADPERFGEGPFFFAFALGESSNRFAWPRLSWKDFPAIRAPLLASSTVVPIATNTPSHNGCVDVLEGDLWHASVEAVIDAVSSAKDLCLVCACDLSDDGAWAFAKAAQDLLALDDFPIAPDLRLTSLDETSLSEAFVALEAGATTAIRVSLYQSKLLQRNFEYNWWLNANALLRPVLASVGLSDARAPSKYELQLLYALRGKDPMTADAVLELMRSWSGTGKYPPLSLGSPKSRAPMLENLLRMGILETSGTDLALSAGACHLLHVLPKDCEDPDLPMRLLHWRSQPCSSAAKANAYLVKWFCKVKKTVDFRRAVS